MAHLNFTDVKLSHLYPLLCGKHCIVNKGLFYSSLSADPINVDPPFRSAKTYLKPDSVLQHNNFELWLKYTLEKHAFCLCLSMSMVKIPAGAGPKVGRRSLS